MEQIREIRRISSESYFVQDKYYNDSYFFLNKEKGVLGIVSEYGNMGYVLDCTCKDFKEILIGIDPYYILSKLKKPVFDLKGTVKNLREWILETRKENNCTKEQALEIWEMIEEIEQEDIEDEGYIFKFFNDNRLLIEEFECDFFCDVVSLLIAKKWTEHDKFFINYIWKSFIDLLKEEKGLVNE